MNDITFSKLLNIDEFYNLFNEGISISSVITILALAFALGLFIFFIYKITFKGVLYSKNFNISLLLMTLITSSIMIAISSNIVLSLGMVGALSIVRFRSAIKDPIDIVYIFWAVSVGITTGSGMLMLSIISTIGIGIVVVLINKINFTNYSFLLVVKSSNIENNEELSNTIKTHVNKFELKSMQNIKSGIEFVFELNTKKELTEMMKELRTIEFVETASLISYNGDYCL